MHSAYKIFGMFELLGDFIPMNQDFFDVKKINIYILCHRYYMYLQVMLIKTKP